MLRCLLFSIYISIDNFDSKRFPYLIPSQLGALVNVIV